MAAVREIADKVHGQRPGAEVGHKGRRGRQLPCAHSWRLSKAHATRDGETMAKGRGTGDGKG